MPPPSQPAFAPPSAPPYSPHPIIKCQDLPLPSLFLTFHHLWQPSQRKQAEQSKAKHSPGALTGYPRASLASPAPWLAKTARKRGSTAKPWHPPLDLRFLASTPSTPRLHILGTPAPTTIPALGFAPKFRWLVLTIFLDPSIRYNIDTNHHLDSVQFSVPH